MYIQPNVYDDTTFKNFDFTFKRQSSVQSKISNIKTQIWERGPFIAILLKLLCSTVRYLKNLGTTWRTINYTAGH